jgi:acyl carrier protein
MKNNILFDDVKSAILKLLNTNLIKFGIEPEEVSNDIDLLQSGIIDSLGFLDLIESLEEDHDLSIDLSKMLDPNLSVMSVFIKEILKQNT